MQTPARTLLVGLVAFASLALLQPPLPAGPPGGTVYLGGKLSDEQLVSFGAAVAARPDAVLLLDSAELSPHLKRFLAEYRPGRVVPVGGFDDGQAGLAARLGVKVELIVEWPSSVRVCPLWGKELTPGRPRVVVCPPSPRPLFLRAARLAANLRVPLWTGGDSASLGDYLREKSLVGVILVGDTPMSLPCSVERVRYRERDLKLACDQLPRDARRGESAVVANPSDLAKGMGGMSALAPWLATTKKAALLLTDEKGQNVDTLVADEGSPELNSLILLANLQAIPTWKRPNPIPGDKDKVIDLEPLTPTPASLQPVSYAIGRLFHDDRAVVPLMLARQRLDMAKPGPRRALVASNPGGGLPMLEAFSRNTALELANAGYEVTQLYGDQLNGRVLRKEFPRHDVVLWEGHHNTLVKDWGFVGWDEPLPSSLVVLQSCLALMPEKVQPMLARGALGVVGTSTRTYSASGGAFSLAYFDALLYEGQTLGGSLRQAKNFLLAYAALKERRLGGEAKRLGANHRAAWAFSLWGDPTYRLPQPKASPTALPAVRHEVEGNEIVVHVPEETHRKVTSERFTTRIPPNARLAGLVRSSEARAVVPLVFAEVRLPGAKAGALPRLRTRVPASSWVFLWDARRKTGWLLATPRPDECGEMRFRVEWSSVRVAGRSE